MRTMGIRPGDVVVVIEHRGERQLVYNALVMSFSMDENLAGARGEPSIQACFVDVHDSGRATLTAQHVVHVSHHDFVEHAGLGYQELPKADPAFLRRGPYGVGYASNNQIKRRA